MGRLRQYKSELTIEINQKGVMDIDTVKGCPFGIANNPNGCYSACYAKKIADFRGYDFSVGVTRKIIGLSHMKSLARKIFRNEKEFIRIGTSS